MDLKLAEICDGELVRDNDGTQLDSDRRWGKLHVGIIFVRDRAYSVHDCLIILYYNMSIYDKVQIS